jgi:hypothetical protein
VEKRGQAARHLQEQVARLLAEREEHRHLIAQLQAAQAQPPVCLEGLLFVRVDQDTFVQTLPVRVCGRDLAVENWEPQPAAPALPDQ